MVDKSVLDFLKEIPDTRRQAGRRHKQEFVLLIVLMAIMSGYYGYRAIGDFIERNRKDLLEYLQPPKNRLPSFFTVRRVLQGLDYVALSTQFYKWSQSYIELDEWEWLSIDGKAIGGTSNKKDGYQNFVSMVSVFVSRQKMVLANGKLINSKESEIPLVQKLITALDLEGVIYTLDALHCQKKQ